MKFLSMIINIAFAASMANARRIPIIPKPACILPCPASTLCVADPVPRCVVVNGFCGGVAAVTCVSDTDYCVDNPLDDCDPKNGGFDCGGICVPKPIF
ncbi:hypothetical protein J7T55_007372 [Diaporthe amygdali]|uniref:uncharacterized protein n=1 Tax=Phomopsis amygdali TaxID=1214568 RepID=UPI0022FEEB7A|nr:uncharacterized protein J7T55_007372 [Diaporthe amygdali]KAJ0116392.1 hypothetical protein J7T55_007372 [Diaporthe amygdali]